MTLKHSWPFDGPAIDGPAAGERLVSVTPTYVWAAPLTFWQKLRGKWASLHIYGFEGGAWQLKGNS